MEKLSRRSFASGAAARVTALGLLNASICDGHPRSVVIRPNLSVSCIPIPGFHWAPLLFRENLLF